jgi:hypothetical protein
LLEWLIRNAPGDLLLLVEAMAVAGKSKSPLPLFFKGGKDKRAAVTCRAYDPKPKTKNAGARPAFS